MKAILDAVPHEGQDTGLDFADPKIVILGAGESKLMKADRLRGAKVTA